MDGKGRLLLSLLSLLLLLLLPLLLPLLLLLQVQHATTLISPWRLCCMFGHHRIGQAACWIRYHVGSWTRKEALQQRRAGAALRLLARHAPAWVVLPPEVMALQLQQQPRGRMVGRQHLMLLLLLLRPQSWS